MLHVRCQKCGWSFTLGREAIAAIVDNLEAKETHYTIECPKCRHGIKVQSRRIKRAYRPQPDQPEAGSAPE